MCGMGDGGASAVVWLQRANETQHVSSASPSAAFPQVNDRECEIMTSAFSFNPSNATKLSERCASTCFSFLLCVCGPAVCFH